MEDDEEIQSHPSGGSGSPVSPRPNGRITVTVAAVPPSLNTLSLALPIQQQQQQQARATGNSGGGGGGGREDCWSEGATGVLIDAWGERFLELSRGNLKQKHWKDVADIVSSREDYTKTPKTDIQCKNRIDTVKKKYKLEKAKIAAGAGPSKWPFFERLDQLIGPSSKLNSSSGVAPGGGGPSGSVPYSGSQRTVPMGIPMGVRSAPQFRQQQQQDKFSQPQLQKQKPQFRKRPPPPPVVDSDEESEPEGSPDSADDFPPETYEIKRPRNRRELMNLGGGGGGVRPGGPGMNRGRDGGTDKASDGGGKNWGNSVRELTRAILKFGEAYEQAESSKLQQLVDMEKQRMKFAKELELQRMQFFMKTQLELSQLKTASSRRVGNNNNHHHSSNNINATTHNNNNNNHSDSSN